MLTEIIKMCGFYQQQIESCYVMARCMKWKLSVLLQQLYNILLFQLIADHIFYSLHDIKPFFIEWLIIYFLGEGA